MPCEVLQALTQRLVGMTQGLEETCHGVVAEGKTRDGLQHLN